MSAVKADSTVHFIDIQELTMQDTKILTEPARRAALYGSLLATLSTLLLCACQPVAAQNPTPELHLDGDFSAGGDLHVGGNLDVKVSNGEPLRFYTVLLVDEGDDTVAALADLQTDAAGTIGRHRLWTRTGVVGCDPGVVHDPLSYLFESYSEAGSVLDGRAFRVLLIDSARGVKLASVDLPMVVATPFLSAYPSDGAGCLRTVLEAEPLHLAISHQAAGDQSFRIFLVAPRDVWSPDDPLVDVTPGGSQVISVPVGADPQVELLWAVPVAGEYQIIVRYGDGTVPLFQEATDLAIETLVSPTGATYPECAICPPPNAD